jgi:hypothetical protein
MENQIKHEIESLQYSMSFFLMLIEDFDSGSTIEEIIDKYTEDWYTQWSYTMTPWSVEVFMPLFKLLQDFETVNPQDLLLSYYWAKFDTMKNLMWKITPKLGRILNETAWLGSKPPDTSNQIPYEDVFKHSHTLKLDKQLLVAV